MTNNEPTNGDDSRRTYRTVGRRDLLKTTAAAAVAAGGVAGSASANDYDTIPANGQSITIGSGETWENKLIDFSTGNRISITAHGTNWTIRNIGFQGFNSDAGKYAIFGLSDQGGNTSVFENVYMGDGFAAGDGGESGPGHGITGVWVAPEHNGHLDIRDCNIQGCYDNAIYASAPGGSGGGTVHIDNCFAANSWVSHYRIASQGSQVTNSVVYLDDEFYDGRGVWGRTPGPIDVVNCELEMNGRQYSFEAGAVDGPCTINVSNTSWDNGFYGGYTTDSGGSMNFQWGNDTSPSAYVPDGVPTSAVEAASGGSSGGGESGDPPEYPVIEDFERDNPLADYGGSTDQFGTTGSAYEGSGALENASGDFGGVNSTSDLNHYPERGDDFEVYFDNASGDNFAAVNFFAQAEEDDPDRYSVGLSGASGDLTFWRTSGGDIDTLDSASPSDTTSGWYRVEVSTDSSSITADLYDDSSDDHLASVSTGDSTFDSGGIGFRSAGNGEVFDYAVFTEDGPTVVEDFERSSPLNEYGGETGLFGTTSSPTYEGSQALENDSGSFGGVNSTSGLDTYPERGDEVHAYFNNASGDNFVTFNLFSQAEADDPDRYAIGLSGVSGDLTLWKTENGSIDTLDSSSLSDTTSGWYRVEITTDSSTVSADLYDDSSDDHLASVSASDSTFSSGGIGFRSAGNGEVFDYVVIDE